MKNKPKVVLDTNVLLSAIIYGGNPLRCLELCREEKAIFYTSNSLLLEFAEKLHIKFDWEEYEVRDAVEGISGFSEVVEPKIDISLIKKDESDNRVLEVAKEVGADFIITGDKRHILPLKKFEKINIVTAVDFIKLVDIDN